MKSIWAKNMSHEKNVHVAYLYTLKPNADTYLELAASNLYRLFVDGAFVGYGPARAAHGYSRLDKYALADWAGKEIVIAVEVYSANVNSYYTVFDQPFFEAHIICTSVCKKFVVLVFSVLFLRFTTWSVIQLHSLLVILLGGIQLISNRLR